MNPGVTAAEEVNENERNIMDVTTSLQQAAGMRNASKRALISLFLELLLLLSLLQCSEAFYNHILIRRHQTSTSSPLRITQRNESDDHRGDHYTTATTTTTTPTIDGDSSSISSNTNNNTNDSGGDDDGDDVWNWQASGSFASLLMQMQKKEQAMRKANKNESQPVLDLDHATEVAIAEEEEEDEEEKTRRIALLEEVEQETVAPEEETDLLEVMDWETVKELDEAVVPLQESPEELTKDIQVLGLGSLYRASAARTIPATTNASTTTTTTIIDDVGVLPLISRPEHYRDHIGRDMRHLAVSIATSTESAAEWRLFCQDHGGLYPLLETIREGTRSIVAETAEETWETNNNRPDTAWLGMSWERKQEESFQASCNACRALRDLCAISPELAAVITDGILRANAAWNVMADFATLLEYANDYVETSSSTSSFKTSKESKRFRVRRRNQKEARLRCKLYVTQLLLSMAVASDDAIDAIRSTEGLSDAILACSSYTPKEKRRRWLRYPGEVAKYFWRTKTEKNADRIRRPFLEAANVANDLKGQVQKTSNQVLAAIGYNQWVPKFPNQKGLRILCLDGGGSRGMAAVTAVNCLMDYVDHGADVADTFDMIGGTSTGGIIAFLTGLRHETSAEAVVRYKQLIKQIFVKGALATPRMVFTTASYDESYFMDVLSGILEDDTMLDSRANPTTPLVFCVTSKMSSTPTHVALFRNYNYAGGELPDHFTIDPSKARDDLGISLDMESDLIRSGSYMRKEVSMGAPPGIKTSAGSRHPGSFRVLQRYALRASTAAPTVFKPVMMGGEMYCDGGIVASNPAAVAIHEARTLFPDVPIEMLVSVGTGAFLEQKTAPRIGWDGIISQIVGSACDGEQVHHVLEDILGDSAVLGLGSSVAKTRYFRFNPVVGLPDEFPIDVTDPEKLAKLQQITRDYMNEPAQREKLDDIAAILKGRGGWRRKWRKWLRR